MIGIHIKHIYYVISRSWIEVGIVRRKKDKHESRNLTPGSLRKKLDRKNREISIWPESNMLPDDSHPGMMEQFSRSNNNKIIQCPWDLRWWKDCIWTSKYSVRAPSMCNNNNISMWIVIGQFQWILSHHYETANYL